MNKQLTPHRFFIRLIGVFGINLLIVLAYSIAVAAPDSDSCSLLKPADLAALLGGTVTAKNNAGSCIWTASGSSKKLIAARIKATGTGAEMAYMGAHQNAAKTGKLADESDIGDKAFSVMPSFGIAMYIIKQGRLLELQYWTGATGTAKDLGALRPIAKKAVVAF